MHLAYDGAYSSLVSVRDGYGTGTEPEVPVDLLDAIWKAKGLPSVAALEVDREGAEADVLAEEELLKTCRPVLILEANETEKYA